MPIQPMKWTQPAPGTYRAYVPGGVYHIYRYAKTTTAPAFWSMDFFDFDIPEDDENTRVTNIEWNSPATVWKHVLDHAKASCQHHANNRLTARLAAREEVSP